MNLMLSKKMRHFLVIVSLFVLSASASAQSVYTRPSVVPQPIPSPSPLVKTTSSVTPSVAAPDVTQPSLEPVTTGMRGILVETVDGKAVMDLASDQAFNPASNVKLATALAVLKTLKPNYRYQTKIYTDGIFNPQDGTITGNLYVVGNDPSFNYEHGIRIADALNKMGVRTVNGDMIVSSNFTLGYTPSALRSGVLLYNAMDASRRPTAALNAWNDYLRANPQIAAQYQTLPSVAVMGSVSTEELPTNLRLLATHESSPLKDILKACLSYSNNFLAERLGDTVGGAYMVANIVRQEANIPVEELYLASSSGLGINRVTPRAMMKVFRALHNELSKHKMSITDILPVAGIDEGTLKNRFPGGSVIGKTGTLPNTDGGVSSLVGQMGTASGEMLFFVIFNQRGNVNRFRNYQDELVAFLQNQRGGAMGFKYSPKYFPTLLSNTKVTTEKSPTN